MDKKIIWQLSSVILLFIPLEVLLQVNLPKFHFITVKKRIIGTFTFIKKSSPNYQFYHIRDCFHT